MERVIYKKNPLVEVILQFKFPKILALNTKDPDAFQNEIADDYPIYQLTIENQHQITFSSQSDQPIPSIVRGQPIKNHNFVSKDGLYKINLTSGFISISTVQYTRWETFLTKFKKPLESFQKIYSPQFYERIGLRYIDAFSKEKLNLKDCDWKDLISPYFLGALGYIDEDKTIVSGLDTEFLLDDNSSRAKIHAGLGKISNSDETVFIIDNDFIHNNNIPTDTCNDILEYLHNNAKRFIREAITDKLHFAMLPEAIE